MLPNFADMSAQDKSKEKKEFAKLLAKRVRDIRLSKNLTQEELAHRAGYYRTYVGHIETATYSPSAHTIWRLAKAMEIDPGDLLKEL
jgi:transcriptional regulator with XRE-family HTH domain